VPESTPAKRNPANEFRGLGLSPEAADERDPDADRERDDRDRWLRENVPPHHH
jgi:hypothetical protein